MVAVGYEMFPIWTDIAYFATIVFMLFNDPLGAWMSTAREK